MLITACSDAQQSSEVAATFVPTSEYKHLSCEELDIEADRLRESIADISENVDKKYDSDQTTEAWAWLFWPVVFTMGNEEDAVRLANAKGEANALAAAMRANGCHVPPNLPTSDAS